MSDLALTPRSEPRLVPAAALAAVLTGTVGAWIVLAGRMAGMDAGPGGDPGALGWFAATWALMTAAMMLPAAAPAVVRVARGWPAKAPAATVSFLAGYGVVWMVAGLTGYGAVLAIRDLHAGSLGWSSAGRYVAAAAVVAAGLYQLTAVKRRWLARCIAPQLPGDRRRSVDALRAGVEHGGCCVACCWTLMAALYALGMMSLSWMALVTVLIVAERVLRPSAAMVRVVAAVLIVLGLAMAAAPASVPGLTIPTAGSPAMSHSMMTTMPG
jgi:predicted metal-binding membrane protein